MREVDAVGSGRVDWFASRTCVRDDGMGIIKSGEDEVRTRW